MHATSQHVLHQHHPHQLQNGIPIQPHHISLQNPSHQPQSLLQLQQQQQQLPSQQNHHQPPHPPSQRSNSSAQPKEPTRVVGIPAAVISGDRFVYGDAQSTSERSYTPIKSVGDGSFGTVWLVDWHSKLPANTPLSAMQCGDGAKPEWTGKRLVALKQMKKRWEGGWDECKKLKELESLRAIPFHPNIIPLYDSFLLPTTKELYFVFEPMEGNLYQLIKSRRGRPLAGGLVSCVFRQVVSGLHHIHANGYFHRDMKPENLLVTTTGLFDYRNVSPVAQPNAPPERDVVVIVKLADFGLARETKSKPPYTEYVSTRWYRAPEVLLRSRDYSNPVDMWALGTIMAELINLKPLFPGSTEIDQVARICEILGDPSDQYGVDARGAYIGGGKWVRGIKMARSVGYQFPKLKPVPIQQLFDRAVPPSIVQCISDLLKYDPDVRLTSKQCLEHPYIMDTMHGNIPPGPQVPLTVGANFVKPTPSMNTITPRTVPPSHSLSPVNGKPPFNGNAQTHRKLFHPQGSDQTINGSLESCEPMQIQTDSLAPPNANADAMDISPISPQMGQQQQQYSDPQPMEVIVTSPGAETGKRIASQSQISPSIAAPPMQASGSGSTKYGLFKSGRLGFGRMFGHGDKAQHHGGLPPVDELNVASSSSSPSLKRTQTGSTDSHPHSDYSSIGEPVYMESPAPMDAKARKKEAERLELEAEKIRRAMAEKRSREQARAVLQKRTMMLKQKHGTDLDWDLTSTSMLGVHKQKPKSRTGMGAQASLSTATINAAGGRFRSPVDNGNGMESDSTREAEHRTKARRRDLDDDHSMSSSDIATGRVSAMSFATVESDPVSTRMRHRPSLFGITRMQSASSLRTSFGDEYSISGHSASSPSYDQVGSDYDSRASMSSYDPTRSSLSEISSPLPMHSLSISSPQQQAQILVNTTGTGTGNGNGNVHRQQYIHLPPVHTMSMSQHHQPPFRAPTPSSPYEYGTYGHGQIQAQPPSPAIAPHSAINPIFKVAPLPHSHSHAHPYHGGDGCAQESPSPHSSLPPFSELASIAEPLPLPEPS